MTNQAFITAGELKLKLCPFCGSEADVDYDNKVDMSRHYDGKIYCTGCEHVSTGWIKGKTQDEAIDNAIRIWNRRHELKAQGAIKPHEQYRVDQIMGGGE